MKTIKKIFFVCFFILNLKAAQEAHKITVNVPARYHIEGDIASININENDGISQVPFRTLIAKKYPFFLARVVSKDNQTKKRYVHYYDADNIDIFHFNGAMFQTDPEVRKHLLLYRDPKNHLPIKDIQYFRFNEEAKFIYTYNVHNSRVIDPDKVEKGNIDFTSGVNHYSGLYGIEKNIEKAKELFEFVLNNPQANQQCKISSIQTLGEIYVHKLFNEIYNDNCSNRYDYKKAKKLLDIVINNPKASVIDKFCVQIDLGIIFLRIDEYYDCDKAKKFFESAFNNPRIRLEFKSIPSYYLGEIYYYGYGVPKNKKMAKKFFEIVINNRLSPEGIKIKAEEHLKNISSCSIQ